MPPEWVKHYYNQFLFPEMAAGKELNDSTQAACVVGHFCEQYVQHVIGGKLGEDVGGDIEPDLVWWCVDEVGSDLVLEVKGCSRYYKGYIDHHQMHNYAGLTGVVFPLTRPQVYYAYVIHGLKRMTATYATEWELVEALGAGLVGVVLLPLDVIYLLAEWMPTRVKTGWHMHRDGTEARLTEMSGPQLAELVTGGGVEAWMRAKANGSRWRDAERWVEWRGRLPACMVHGVYVRSVWAVGLLPK
jgi:hypothetical protein